MNQSLVTNQERISLKELFLYKFNRVGLHNIYSNFSAPEQAKRCRIFFKMKEQNNLTKLLVLRSTSDKARELKS